MALWFHTMNQCVNAGKLYLEAGWKPKIGRWTDARYRLVIMDYFTLSQRVRGSSPRAPPTFSNGYDGIVA